MSDKDVQARLANGERGIPKIPDAPDTRHAQAQPPTVETDCHNEVAYKIHFSEPYNELDSCKFHRMEFREFQGFHHDEPYLNPKAYCCYQFPTAARPAEQPAPVVGIDWANGESFGAEQPVFRDFGPMSCCICGDPTINRKFLPSEEMIALHVCRTEKKAPPPQFRPLFCGGHECDGKCDNARCPIKLLEELDKLAAAKTSQPSAPPQPAESESDYACNKCGKDIDDCKCRAAKREGIEARQPASEGFIRDTEGERFRELAAAVCDAWTDHVDQLTMDEHITALGQYLYRTEPKQSKEQQNG